MMMKRRFNLLFSIAISVFYFTSGYSQQTIPERGSDKPLIDSLIQRGVIRDTGRIAPGIILSREQALIFLREKIEPHYWYSEDHPLRIALSQLVYEASFPPFDTAKKYLIEYPYDSLSIPWDKFYIWEPLRLKVPSLVDEVKDTIALEDIEGPEIVADSLVVVNLPERIEKRDDLIVGLKDTTVLVIVDTLKVVRSPGGEFPIRYYTQPWQADSIRIAVSILLDHVEARDSSIIYFTGIRNDSVSVWLNSRTGSAMRYWLKNELNDSVTVWIGNPARNTIGLYLEHGVSFRRPVMQGNWAGPSVNVQSLEKRKLQEVTKIAIKHQYWKYRTETAFTLNQAAMSNWVKGGESNISTSLDITGYADYDNKVLKLSSNNFGRIKYGLIASGDKGIRKNLDLFETNSKLNHKAFGKFDFSSILLFKTQMTKGYNYPNDSVPVSKFMNPAILTLGFGLDYKPDKNTSINISPFSYKGTFVPDTARIDQTKYGIPADRRSKNEPGASVMVSNKINPSRNIAVTSRLQLFTNYINNPQNIDVDWEVIMTARLNWFTEVRLNTHLIFDDDTKTVVLDNDKNPVLRPDGTQKKTARIQFKELLGFSFVFRF